jgi:hypothetical protein
MVQGLLQWQVGHNQRSTWSRKYWTKLKIFLPIDFLWLLKENCITSLKKTKSIISLFNKFIFLFFRSPFFCFFLLFMPIWVDEFDYVFIFPFNSLNKVKEYIYILIFLLVCKLNKKLNKKVKQNYKIFSGYLYILRNFCFSSSQKCSVIS